MVCAVLFDLDDTLFDHQYGSRAALEGVRSMHPRFEQMGIDAFDHAHSRLLEALHLDVMIGRLDPDVARVERFRRLYRSVGVEADDALASRAAASYRAGFLASRRPIAGAVELLEAVRLRARVGIVSNNLLDEQRGKLAHLGLAPYVDELVVSEEAGLSKPDPRIFEIALSRLGCRADEAVMVGDSWAADIEGAVAAHVRPVWLNRHGGDPPSTGGITVRMITALEPTADVLRVIFDE
ncbi:MAG TPA: HAD-IA family hydrolase [Vicinamibacterales bacterium]|nr:HAD-IA family hydrolase [Vicinamibacterales bacterium]